MTLPTFIFGTLISIFFASVFHVWRRGGGGKLLIYLLLSFTGFWGGHILGNLMELYFLVLGPLNLSFAVIGSIAGLFAGQYFSEINPDQY